jgi:DNA-binding NarL/FixJ family response regulator
MTIRVLVADDEALLRTAFSALIDAEDDLQVVGEAADGKQAVQRAAGSRRTWCSWTCGCR